MAIANYPDKDPANVEPFFMIWCSKDGTNDGSSTDTGELQGATISTSAWVLDTGLTADSDNTSAITIQGVTYAINTVATVWVSGGTAGEEYTLKNTITTSDSRTLIKRGKLKIALL